MDNPTRNLKAAKLTKYGFKNRLPLSLAKNNISLKTYKLQVKETSQKESLTILDDDLIKKNYPS